MCLCHFSFPRYLFVFYGFMAFVVRRRVVLQSTAALLRTLAVYLYRLSVCDVSNESIERYWLKNCQSKSFIAEKLRFLPHFVQRRNSCHPLATLIEGFRCATAVQSVITVSSSSNYPSTPYLKRKGHVVILTFPPPRFPPLPPHLRWRRGPQRFHCVRRAHGPRWSSQHQASPFSSE